MSYVRSETIAMDLQLWVTMNTHCEHCSFISRSFLPLLPALLAESSQAYHANRTLGVVRLREVVAEVECQR